MKRTTIIFLFVASIFFATNLMLAAGSTCPPILPECFSRIPDETKPWVYYWWLKGNVSQEQITHDLEEMREKGIGGILLFDSRGYHDDFDSKDHVPVPLQIKYEFMSPQWRDMVKHTINESARLGLKVSINIANTGGQLRGPWDMKELGPKELVWAAVPVHASTRYNEELVTPLEKRYFTNVALIGVRLSVPSAASEKNDWDNPSNKVTAPTDKSPTVLEIVDLRDNIKNGRLVWDVPEGNWEVIRFGYTVVGDVGSVDILSAEACTDYFHKIGTVLLADAGEHAGKTLTHFYNVSWEGSLPDWTKGFETMFSERNGYDIDRFLPVLAGRTVDDLAVSQRFLSDYYKTVSHCFRKNCYTVIGNLCHEKGIRWHSENGGPWTRSRPLFREADMLSFLGENDIAQGEFWVTETDEKTRSNMRYISMAGHIYGQPEIAVEAFTHMVRHWTMYPARLKPAADENFVDGANMFIWHTFTASPPEFGKPGYEYFAGTHLNTNVTWWNDVKPFMDYLGRCQYLLRQGRFAADACVYGSDKNHVNWGRAEKWNPDSKLVLPPGYSYDLLDTEVLVNRLTVRDGKLVLPGGMEYRFLVLDPLEDALPASALAKIVKLVQDGATVVLGDKRPMRTPGLTSYPACDKEISAAVEVLWGNYGETPFKRSLGNGTIVYGKSLTEILADMKLPPDFSGPFEYHHRTLADGKDIYFVKGTGKADCIFRVTKKKPTLWNAVTGKTTTPLAYAPTEDGRMRVTLDFAEFDSTFVVFDGPLDKNYVANISGPEQSIDVDAGDGKSRTFWKSGSYSLTTVLGTKKELSVNLPAPLELQGPWEVRFDPNRGGPEKTSFEKLILWNEHPDPSIKYYSGTATYVKTFSVDEKQIDVPARLTVGAAHNIAKVKLNGKNLGILWTAPRTVDVTAALLPGENRLEIDVTNCWANRLIGDAGLPADQRLTKTNIYLVPDRKVGDRTYRAFQGFSAKDNLLVSGLLGPILVEFGQKTIVELE